jgi:hypothetical protein
MLLHAPVLAALGARSTNIYTTSVMQMPFNRLVSDVFCIRGPYNHADLNAIALPSVLTASPVPVPDESTTNYSGVF